MVDDVSKGLWDVHADFMGDQAMTTEISLAPQGTCGHYHDREAGRHSVDCFQKKGGPTPRGPTIENDKINHKD